MEMNIDNFLVELYLNLSPYKNTVTGVGATLLMATLFYYANKLNRAIYDWNKYRGTLFNMFIASIAFFYGCLLFFQNPEMLNNLGSTTALCVCSPTILMLIAVTINIRLKKTEKKSSEGKLEQRKNPYFLYLIITLVVLWLGAKSVDEILLRIKQHQLAEHLGVDLREYPSKPMFPQIYFYSVIVPGMTKSEVRKIMIGYEIALTCGNNKDQELYYYYDKDKEDALRIMVVYDLDGKFHKFMGEGDSNWLYDKDCVLGLFDE